MLKAISLILRQQSTNGFLCWFKMSLANISGKIFLVGSLLGELQRQEFQSIGTNFSQSETKQNIKDRREISLLNLRMAMTLSLAKKNFFFPFDSQK